MVTLTVLYPKNAASHFNHDYYRDTHTPLVKSRFAPERVDILQGVSSPDGSPATYELIANIVFASVQQMQHALATHGPEVIADIANFTNVQPILQINKPIV